MDNKMSTELPKLAMDDIPTPAADAVSITGLVKKSGRVSPLCDAEDQPRDGRNGQPAG